MAPDTGRATPTSAPAPRVRMIAIAVLLAVTVWGVFGQTLGHDFVLFDDDLHVYENPHVARGMSFDGLIWAFTHEVNYNIHPLTTLSHMLDCEVFGLKPGGHHLTSVLLHMTGVVLLFLVLWSMTGGLWESAFVAGLFAIHPQHVESIAWVAERKDVLSGVFFMTTLWAYLRYVRRPPSWRRYLVVVVSFALGLMSKPMLVTLPLVLLLLDYWPLGRLAVVPKTRLLLEKVPLLLLSAAASLMTLHTQRDVIVTLPLSLHLGNAVVSYAAYIGQMVYPAHLVPHYPFPLDGIPFWQLLLSTILLLGVSAAALLLRRRCPYLVVGWLWYLVMLVPAIGVVSTGLRARADRFTYLPEIGLYLIVAWGVAQWARDAQWRQRAAAAVGVAVVVVLGGVAWVQTGHWKNSGTLWRHTLAHTSRNSEAHSFFGNALLRMGRAQEAIAEHEKALAIAPHSGLYHFNMAVALEESGQSERAAGHYEKTLEVDPGHTKARCNLAGVLLEMGKKDEAMAQYRRALEIDPGLPEAHSNLGVILLGAGQVDAAAGHFEQALVGDPDLAEAHTHLGDARLRQGRTREAIASYEAALRLEPQSGEALNNLAWVLATNNDPSVRAGARAVALAESAVALSGGIDVLDTLAAAYAEAGRPAEAVAAIEMALGQARESGRPELISPLEEHLKLYRAGHPLREGP